MNIPFTLSALRQAGLTQTQIGTALGRSQTSVSDMETGKVKAENVSYPVVENLKRLARRHRVPTEPPQQST